MKTLFSKDKLIKFYNKYGILVILIGLIIICSCLSPVFLSKDNIINLLSQIAVVTIVSCGMTMLIIAGQTDLSGGSIVALTGCVCVGMFKQMAGSGLNSVLAGIFAVGIAVLLGIAVNMMSGAIVAKFNAPAFIVTLAMMNAGRGACYIYTNGVPIYNIGGIVKLGQGRIANIIPYSCLIMIGCIAVAWFILKRTRLGRHIYAVGGNPEAATASGISIKKTLILIFLIHGIFIGIAGALFMTRLNSGQPAEAVGLEFTAITAAIIGGTSLMGGIGGISGTIVGSVIMGIITNILQLKSVQSYYQMIFTGAIIVIAVILDLLTKGKKN